MVDFDDAHHVKEPVRLPNKPITLDPLTMQQTLFACPPEKRTAAAERLLRAHNMMDDIEQIQRARRGGRDVGEDEDEDEDESLVDIRVLKTDPSYVRECVLWIQASASSDFRVAYTQEALSGSPLPSCWTHITSLHPLDDHTPQL